MKKTKENQLGITMIALIVTVIVLLILAGISIATLTNEGGIIPKAIQAKKSTNLSGIIEIIELEISGCIDKRGVLNKEKFKNNIEKNLEGSSVIERNNLLIVKKDDYKIAVNAKTGDVIGKIEVEPEKIVSKTEKNNYSDGINMATVPKGFTVSGLPDEQIIANGLVIYDIPESEITSVDWNTAQTKYNQFVWIPVASAEEYQRNFSFDSYYENNLTYTPQNSTFTDVGYLPIGIQPEIDDSVNNEIAERNAVLKYNGFYIARYEIGEEKSKPVSKQNIKLMVIKSQEEFKEIGRKMYGEESENVKSAMCSGIQWDMIMKFVDGKKDGNGNEFNVKASKQDRHTGFSAETGKNVADNVQNIYDLEGNNYEYVAEKNNTSNAYVLRGGAYLYYADHNASKRNKSNGGRRWMEYFSFGIIHKLI